MRNNLREKFKIGTLYNSIDSRYKIETAHCTVLRFIKELINMKVFIDFLKENRDKYFGNTLVSEIELVYTDWYHKEENVRELHKFKL
jgi:hypothetical protein